VTLRVWEIVVGIAGSGCLTGVGFLLARCWNHEGRLIALETKIDGQLSHDVAEIKNDVKTLTRETQEIREELARRE
jgi:hypothetical protein